MQNVQRSRAQVRRPGSGQSFGSIEQSCWKGSYREHPVLRIRREQGTSCLRLPERKFLAKHTERERVRKFQFAERRQQDGQLALLHSRGSCRGVRFKNEERNQKAGVG